MIQRSDSLGATRCTTAERVVLEATRPFTFWELDELTPELNGAERCDAFCALPDELKNEAWTELAQRLRASSELDEHDWIDEPERPTRQRPASATGPSYKASVSPIADGAWIAARRPPAWADEVLRTIEPREYVQALTGEDVPASGVMRCPLPSHDDRSPSFHAYADAERGWFCFGCGRGGDIFDLASAMWGIGTRGRDFHRLRQRLAQTLLRAA